MKPIRSLVLCAAAVFASSAFLTTPAQAGLIGTDQVAAPQLNDRDRVKAALDRPDVAQKLQMLGVLPADAKSRVDALTDAEVATLAKQIDLLPAGGLTNNEWIVIGVVAFLIILALAL
jgi:hypothetical protein